MRGLAPRVWAAAALALALVLGAPATSSAAPPVWKVHYGKAEVVLFGSIHLLNPDLDWRSPELDAELAQASEIWFEVPLDEVGRGQAQAEADALSRLPPGRSLSALLSAKGRARLARVSKALGVPIAMVDAYRPWFAEVVLTLIELRGEGADQASGVEETLSRAAPPDAPRRAFETPDQQIRMLGEAPQSDQVASLEETLKELDEDPHEFAALEKAWTAGDVAWIEREAITPLRKASPGLYRRLVTARNGRWAEAIDHLLKSGEHAFIVVGVGHLVGSDGVPALLRRRGFTVEGP